MFKIDHIVFAASSLEEGTSFLENHLQTKLSDIGHHEFMGTHNRVLKIGKSVYLEVIAIDPNAKSLEQKRWFNLDDLKLQKKLQQKPQLIGYVIETYNKNIFKHYLPFFRAQRGNYKWNFAMPKPLNNELHSGIIDNGIMPSIINWDSESPIHKMQDSRFELENLGIAITELQFSYKNFIRSIGHCDQITYLFDANSENQIKFDYPKLKLKLRDTFTNKLVFL